LAKLDGQGQGSHPVYRSSKAPRASCQGCKTHGTYGSDARDVPDLKTRRANSRSAGV